MEGVNANFTLHALFGKAGYIGQILVRFNLSLVICFRSNTTGHPKEERICFIHVSRRERE